MRYAAAVLAILIIGGDAIAAEQLIYLKCRYADPINNVRGPRHVIATIDQERQKMQLDDHDAGGSATYQYTLTEVGETLIVGTAGGDRRMTIDRIAGRMTLFSDITQNADRLWNEEMQQIGGFDLADGQRIWISTTLDCKKSAPVL